MYLKSFGILPEGDILCGEVSIMLALELMTIVFGAAAHSFISRWLRSTFGHWLASVTFLPQFQGGRFLMNAGAAPAYLSRTSPVSVRSTRPSTVQSRAFLQ